MDKINYLEENIEVLSRAMFKALQACLNPEESCTLISKNLMIDSNKKNYIVRKIKKDIEQTYSEAHKSLIRKLLKILKSNTHKYTHRNRASLILYELYPSLPRRTQSAILKQMLTSKYKPVRDRSYKIIMIENLRKYDQFIQENWENYFDFYAGEIIYKNFSIEYIYSQISNLKEVLEDWRVRQIYAKLATKYPKLINNLKEDSPLDYVYIMAKSRTSLSEEYLMNLYNEVDNSDKGLIVWALGEMGMWEILIKIEREGSFISW